MSEVMHEVKWRVTTRPWSYGYEDGDEKYGSALAEIRKGLGFETTEQFSQWIYEECTRRHGSFAPDVPSVLLDAFEYPALSVGEGMYVIDSVAQALNVSPGTLMDELWLRASGRYREDGTEIPEDERE